ncbi:[protein-PII] uridylyltransferase [bacterium]|nr:[protein-PII] uridylyltransferase [bacterium]
MTMDGTSGGAPMRRIRPGPWRIDDIVDARKLQIQLDAAALDNASDPAARRARAIDLIHAAWFRGRMIAQERLEDGGDGLDTAWLLGSVMDQVLAGLYGFVTNHVYPSANQTEAERLSVIAVGGYGRQVLAPSSDVDLLFLRNYKATAWSESVIEFMLYALWDMGMKVGHAYRTIDECIKLARDDVTIRTSILDQRHLLGDPQLALKLQERFRKDLVAGKGAEFAAAKLAERDARHAKEGGSRYRVEPNVKDGKGGLRDLQTLFWIAKYLHGGDTLRQVLNNAAFAPGDAAVYMRQARFLWTVRCHLHYLTGRGEDRLSFDLQPEMAKRMGFKARGGVSAVERFMKRYFIAAKEVGALTRILCASLEADEKKRPSGLQRFIPALPARPIDEPGFAIEGGRLTVSDPDLLRREPVKLMRLFWLAEDRGMDVHPAAMKAIRNAARRVGSDLRDDPNAQKMFLEIISGRKHAVAVLRLMSEAGLLGRFVPEFGRITGQTQFNMYHHFTVDDHTLRAIEIIHDIEAGRFADEHPLATEILPKVRFRKVLYLAMLLHDVGKGLGDQQIEGAKSAEIAAIRLGLNPEEAELTAWLVGHHLLMSDTAQRRDLSDPQTIAQFSAAVGTLERLRLLLVLTVADIRAVGPGVWNGWKGQLLRDLYRLTDAALKGGRTDERSLRALFAERANEARAALKALRPSASPALLSVEDAYWVQFGSDVHERHASQLADPDAEVSAEVWIDDTRSTTEVLVTARDRIGLFADLCSTFAAYGANVTAAYLYEGESNRVLDVFEVQDSSGAPLGLQNRSTLERLKQDLKAAARGEGARRPSQKIQPSRRHAAFIIEPTVRIDRSASSRWTVVEVSGRDRPGVLHEIAQRMVVAGLSIRSAHVGSYGERVHDVFYVECEDGSPLPPEADEALIAALEDVFHQFAPAAPSTPARTLARAPASPDR